MPSRTPWLSMLDILVTAWLGRVMLSAVLIPLITFIVTSVRFHLQSLRREADQEPPTLPYAVPWIGSALNLIWDTHRFLTYVKKKNGGRPVKICLANEKPAYILSRAQDVQSLFRASKELTFEEFSVRVLEKVKKFPREDGAKMEADTSGSSVVPLHNVPESTRIWRAVHANYDSNLTGSGPVSALTNRLLEDKMFRASTRTLVGDAIFDLSPSFTADFWGARERVFGAVKAYIAQAWHHLDPRRVDGLDWDFDDHFGSRLVRTREAMYANYGLSLDGRAASEMGLIWSINSNAIPMVSWMLVEILSDAHLLSRVQQEILSCVTEEGESIALARLDVSRVLSLPLLNACYAECLRMRASVQAIRELRTEIRLGGYTLKPGNLVMAPSCLAHYDEATWGADGHPASVFCADRFLRPAKGRYKFYNPATAGQYFPYGGGAAICPGRFYAKAEMLAAVALFLCTLEVQPVGFVDARGHPSSQGPSMGTETRGTMRLDKDLKILYRRRERVMESIFSI
ncbi:Cholesterol 7-alpha-monooxygenase [Apiospora phragmitis]|uniref:Cholesterol 7-alpha-monooxygenase n=1 Tax=Apiospora phragmitis TaxID=2905665 RepID=A0ABR1VZW8_9PEZI